MGKGSQWKLQTICYPQPVSLFKGFCISKCHVAKLTCHTSNQRGKCPLQGFNVTSRQISWKKHYQYEP